MSIGNALFLIVPSFALYIFWIVGCVSENGRKKFWLAWLFFICALFSFGVIGWEPNGESTRLGSALLFSSTIWLTGPALRIAINRNWNEIVILPMLLFLPMASVLICFFLLLMAGQIWF